MIGGGERESNRGEEMREKEKKRKKRERKAKEERRGPVCPLSLFRWERERSEASERTKAREIGKRGHWLFVARSTYGNRYGPAVGMRSFFPFCVSLYLASRSRSVAAAVAAAAANLSRAILSAGDR